MTGSPLFSLENSDKFVRSFKKLSKAYNTDFLAIVSDCLENLLVNPYPSTSRDEPLPKKTRLPQGWTFHKLELRVGKGASGQIRLMYLVNEEIAIIRPLWIYSHEQFKKRPADQEIDGIIQKMFEEG